ncbi:Putative thioredoxin [Arabidopsis thaliana]|uniref:Thioredoxin H7 n=3 Tax=Arabidopsis TaxID=3701 RepID=TRXH7_ARATH|nr:thioredoxin H-type 7 [Arabidopsis thaliana]Q9XIF4.1 RecName: Full=Thioredoxin H7; Short=AtTrxh7 [Arabidopsis thaliana]KAG7650009.1 Thioredoxin domain [Arabidopsis thaliana x Arabidopsis arenosa]AAD39316.1 Putative thioredoxin [Arabidopsis thaliana]AAO24572.1 At1g59730 [Arabidopsis thaliana]AEE33610.1 thioredoxin H-type 7 [Arabidopsis thaliana]OAP19862.1 TH7 [Arabidopsis thaliana]|eukprot:NP_176182.1 thioredoxin H-type 7 [Arabidopsis thaliana]
MGSNVSSVHDVHSSMEITSNGFVVEIESRRQWKSLFDSMKGSNKLLVIDFTAVWCGPCKAMEPRVREIASKYSEAVFARVDVDRLMDVAGTYRAITLPAFVFVKRGEEIDRVVGAKPDELVKKIEQHRV